MLSKQQLGNLLWGMADTGLRGKVEDYKAYILSLLFFKRLSDNYEWETQNRANEFTEQFGSVPTGKQLERLRVEGHDFVIPAGCFWKDVRQVETSEKNDKLNACVQTIAEANPPLKGIINSVRWNEPAPDDSGHKRIEPEVLIAAMNVLDHIPLDNSNVSPDILGDAYEYLIKRFADENKGGTTAGQFYTPPEVREIIIRMIQPQPGQSFYDPTCGSGGFLIDAAKYTSEIAGVSSLRLSGQESVWNTWAIANINMHLHGLAAMSKIEQGNTIKNPKFLSEDTTQVRKFDRVAANFPFSEENWWLNGKPKLDAKGRAVLKKNGSPQLEYPDKGTFIDPFGRFTYGVPPFSSGDFVFLQHIVSSIAERGRAGVVCPTGVLFRGQPAKTEEEDGQNRKPDDEYLIRRGFLEGPLDRDASPVGERRCLLEAVVVLPDNLFYGTPIPGTILFFNRDKPPDRANKILMVHAARPGWYREAPDQNVIRPHDVLRILIQLLAWGDLDEARRILPAHKSRLYDEIRERVEFEQAEMRLRVREEVSERIELRSKLASKKATEMKKAECERIEKRLTRLDDIIAKAEVQVLEAGLRAQKEREDVDAVEAELLGMFADPDLRKRYFAIVDTAEIADNDFSLLITRYVEPAEEDTLEISEPETQRACTLLEREAAAENALFAKLEQLTGQRSYDDVARWKDVVVTRQATLQGLAARVNEASVIWPSWRERRMGELGEFYGGSTPSSSDPTLWDGDIEWLVPSDLTALPPEQRMILQAGRRITKRGYDSCATRLLPEGAISMCSRATIGDCVILGVPMCTNQGFINIVTNDLVNNRFLLHWIRANKPAILRFSAGTTFDEIGRRTFKRIKLHLPEDPEEQKRIADFLDAFDDLLLARRESVALLSPVRDVLARGLTRGVVSLTQASKDQP